MTRTIVGVLVFVFIAFSAASAQPGGPSPSGRSPEERFSFSAEALVWWLKNSPAPVPVVSTGDLAQPGTQILLGGTDLDTGAQPGLRVTAGYRLTDTMGLDASVFYLPSRSTSRSVSSSGAVGSQTLFTPFFDVTLGREDVTPLSLPGVFAGEATETLSTRLLGAELNGVMTVASGARLRVDVLAGFRYLNLREIYTFTTNSPFIPPLPADVFQTEDRFDATNNFYGGQVGVRARSGWGPWSASGVVKVALGAVVESVDVDGFLLTNDFNGFGAPQRFRGGYFAQPTNMGRHTRTVFAVVPEVGLNVGYQVTDMVAIFAGYTFLYVSQVARPGDQIDRSINPTQNASFGGAPPTPLVGAPRPEFRFQGSDFWAQGLNVGIAVRY